MGACNTRLAWPRFMAQSVARIANSVHHNTYIPIERSRRMAMERWSHSTERITREDVDTFADLSGDKNVLHMDEAVAEKSRFNGTIVHGVLVEGLVSRAISDLAHPGEVAVFIEKETKFIAPVRPGDLVEVEAGVRVENIDPDSAVRQPAFSVKAGPDAENMSLVMKGSATVMFDSVGL